MKTTSRKKSGPARKKPAARGKPRPKKDSGRRKPIMRHDREG